MPTFVQLRVTNLCNLRCKMCGQWGDTGIFRSSSRMAAPRDGAPERARIQELDRLEAPARARRLRALLDEVAAGSPIISLFGGEPFLYPDILPLIARSSSRGLTCTVITNGGRLEALARDLVELGIDSIAISIDGPPEVHNRIRGARPTLREGRRRASARWRAGARSSAGALPMLIAILPVTELNSGRRSVRPSRRCGELPLDTINVGLRWFVPENVGAEYERVMREELGVEATSWKGFDFDGWPDALRPEGKPMTELVRLMKALRRRRFLDSTVGRPWTSFVPDVPAARVPCVLQRLRRDLRPSDLCPVAWYFAQVEPDGEVCFCGDFPDYFIGNVRRQPFRDIWTGEKAARFRAKLAKEPLPICARCCGNFVYGKWQRPPVTAASNP